MKLYWFWSIISYCLFRACF